MVSEKWEVGTTFELYFADYKSYPTNGTGFWGVLANCGPGTQGCLPGIVPNYIGQIPVAPMPPDGICKQNYNGSIANDYQYQGTGTSTNITDFQITFCLGSKTGTYGSGVHTLTEGGIQ